MSTGGSTGVRVSQRVLIPTLPADGVLVKILSDKNIVNPCKTGYNDQNIRGKVARFMEQYEVMLAKELFAGSDIVRRFGYKMQPYGITAPFFGATDCFVCCLPWNEIS